MLLPLLRSYSSPPSLEEDLNRLPFLQYALISIVTYLSGFVKFMFELLDKQFMAWYN